MSILTNPLIVTYGRLAHRSGVAWAVCLLVLAGLAVLFMQWRTQAQEGSPENGLWFYTAILGVQGVLVVMSWGGKTSAAIAAERKDNMLEANWLAPLSARQLAAGYLLGPSIAALYFYVTTLPIALTSALLAELPLRFWAMTQAVVLGTGLLFGLLGLFGGIVLRAGNGGGIVLSIIFLNLFGLGAIPLHLSLTSFLVPIHTMVGLYAGYVRRMGSFAEPRLFALEIPSSLLTAAVMGAAGGWLWTATRRKIASPHDPAMGGNRLVLLFAMGVFAQNALIWHLARGGFPNVYHSSSTDVGRALAAVHVVTMLIGMLMVFVNLSALQRVKVGDPTSRSSLVAAVWRQSGVWLAIRLAAVGSLGLLTHCAWALTESPLPFLLASSNLLLGLLAMALILELSALWFDRWVCTRAALVGLFVLYVAPFALAYGELPGAWCFSPLVPGAYFLGKGGEDKAGIITAMNVTAIHGVIVAVLGVLWWRGWSVLFSAKRESQDQFQYEPRP